MVRIDGADIWRHDHAQKKCSLAELLTWFIYYGSQQLDWNYNAISSPKIVHKQHTELKLNSVMKCINKMIQK